MALEIEAVGFRDVDGQHRSTMPSCFPVLDLDHFMVNEHVAAQNFSVASHLPVSDHRAIGVELLV